MWWLLRSWEHDRDWAGVEAGQDSWLKVNVSPLTGEQLRCRGPRSWLKIATNTNSSSFPGFINPGMQLGSITYSCPTKKSCCLQVWPPPHPDFMSVFWRCLLSLKKPGLLGNQFTFCSKLIACISVAMMAKTGGEKICRLLFPSSILLEFAFQRMSALYLVRQADSFSFTASLVQ